MVAKLDVNFRACEKHTYIIPDDGDPRWEQIFARAPTINTRYHGPLPPGDVADLVVMFILRTMTDVGYDEVIYFANKGDVARWNYPKTEKKLGAIVDRKSGEYFYESLCRQHPTWTLAQLLDHVEALLDGGDKS